MKDFIDALRNDTASIFLESWEKYRNLSYDELRHIAWELLWELGQCCGSASAKEEAYNEVADNLADLYPEEE